MIRKAEPDDLPAVRALFLEYAAWVGGHICFEAFERELANLPGDYAPPGGRLLLSFINDHLAGCVALRRLGAATGEMKRLYVRPEFQHAGVGRALIEHLMSEAAAAGYSLIRLDTLPRMENAIRLYRALGFREISRYGDNPESALCFEADIYPKTTRS